MKEHINNSPVIKLTDHAIDFMEKYGNPIISKDFVGYTILVDEKVAGKVALAIGLDNSIVPFSLNINKPLSFRKVKKIINFLIDTNFIKDASYDPFPEFERYNNIKFDINKATHLNGYTMVSTFNVEDDFVPDDDFDIGIMDNIVNKLNIKVEDTSKDI